MIQPTNGAFIHYRTVDRVPRSRAATPASASFSFDGTNTTPSSRREPMRSQGNGRHALGVTDVALSRLSIRRTICRSRPIRCSRTSTARRANQIQILVETTSRTMLEIYRQCGRCQPSLFGRLYESKPAGDVPVANAMYSCFESGFELLPTYDCPVARRTIHGNMIRIFSIAKTNEQTSSRTGTANVGSPHLQQRAAIPARVYTETNHPPPQQTELTSFLSAGCVQFDIVACTHFLC